MRFYQVEPTLENYWRGIILFGKNVASYQFALAHADMARLHATLGEPGAARDEWRKALALPCVTTSKASVRSSSV